MAPCAEQRCECGRFARLPGADRGRFEDLSTGEALSFTILGPWDVDPDRGILSYDSPLARQLLDRPVGSEFQVVLPQREMTLRLVALENAVTRVDSA